MALASVLSCGGSPCVLWLPLWLWLRLLPLPRSLPESDAGCLSKLTPRQGQMQEEETTTCGLFPLLVRLLERVEEGKGRCPDRVRYTGLFSLSSGGVSWGCVNAASPGASERRKRRGSLRFCRQTPTLRTRPCRQDTLLATPRGEADEPLEPRSLLPLPWLEPGDGGDGPPSKELRLDQRTMWTRGCVRRGRSPRSRTFYPAHTNSHNTVTYPTYCFSRDAAERPIRSGCQMLLERFFRQFRAAFQILLSEYKRTTGPL